MRFVKNVLLSGGLALAVGAGAAQASTLIDIPAAGGVQYNGFFQQNYTGINSDVEGALAVGGNTNIQNYGLGSRLDSSVQGANTLVVGGKLTVVNTQLSHGNAVVGSQAGQLSVPNGSITQGSAIDFDGAFTQLQLRSNELGQLAANGVVQNNWGGLKFIGTDAGLNVFNLSGSDLSSAWGMEFVVNPGSTILVNVDASSVVWQNMQINLGGLLPNNVLFNFSDATNLQLGGISIAGSILAPLADIVFNNGHINGALIGKSFYGSGELHHVAYNGGLLDVGEPVDVVPEPSTWALLISGFGLVGASLRARRKRNAFSATVS